MPDPSIQQYQKIFSDNLMSDRMEGDEINDFLSHIRPMFDGPNPIDEALERFTIYRNNVMLSLSTAIADTFPVVQRLIGEDCFRSAALAFVRENPPRQASLLFYGEGFIEFVRTFPACESLQYLSDVAQLEWNYIQAFHAADSEENNRTQGHSVLEAIPAELLSEASFQFHPSVHLMQSNWPVDCIWEENLKEDVTTIDLENGSACNLLIFRRALQVQIINLNNECFDFLEALFNSKCIGDAWTYTVDKQHSENRELEDSELSGILAYLLELDIFTSAETQSVGV